ncbi:MAG: hypothetical protein AAF297_10135 [Planctomycetota bacterium]
MTTVRLKNYVFWATVPGALWASYHAIAAVLQSDLLLPIYMLCATLLLSGYSLSKTLDFWRTEAFDVRRLLAAIVAGVATLMLTLECQRQIDRTSDFKVSQSQMALFEQTANLHAATQMQLRSVATALPNQEDAVVSDLLDTISEAQIAYVDLQDVVSTTIESYDIVGDRIGVRARIFSIAVVIGYISGAATLSFLLGYLSQAATTNQSTPANIKETDAKAED